MDQHTIEEVLELGVDWYHVVLFFAGVLSASLVDHVVAKRFPRKVVVCLFHPKEEKKK
jgi:hypothetical protein